MGGLSSGYVPFLRPFGAVVFKIKPSTHPCHSLLSIWALQGLIRWMVFHTTFRLRSLPRDTLGMSLENVFGGGGRVQGTRAAAVKMSLRKNHLEITWLRDMTKNLLPSTDCPGDRCLSQDSTLFLDPLQRFTLGPRHLSRLAKSQRQARYTHTILNHTWLLRYGGSHS